MASGDDVCLPRRAGCLRMGGHMSDHSNIHKIGLLFYALLLPSLGWAQTNMTGIFDNHRDIGQVFRPGAAAYDAARQIYEVTGGGDNMWATTDAFHFLWKRMSGDLALTADIRWTGSGGNAHRKACLIIRQSLNPDAPYIDAALHGNGLTS